jgi:Undecaprenyl-phosphate galactose phosphotransferase WbaP
MNDQLAVRPRVSQAIVSTDAMESLAPPYVPLSSDAEVPRLQRRRQEVFLSGSHFFQKTVTLLPLLVGDMVAVFCSFYAATAFLSLLVSSPIPASFWLEGLLVVGVFVLLGSFSGLYPATGASPVFELKHCVQTAFLAFGTLVFAEKFLAHLSVREFWGAFFGGAIAMLVVPIVRSAVRQLCSRTNWWGERAIVIGTGPQAQAIYRFYQRSPQRGLRPVGVVELPSEGSDLGALGTHSRWLGATSDIDARIGRHRAHWGIIVPDSEHSDVLKHCAAFRHVIVIATGASLPSLWTSSRECAGVTGFYFRDNLRSPLARGLKRTMDVVGSLLGLTIGLPIFVVAICWIKAKSPGPVFYSQNRVGQGGQVFRAWKFRTMVTNADEVLEHYLESDYSLREEWIMYQKLRNDPRVIPGVGGVLRRSSLDELPQLWNILKGDMSLVGPRPCMSNQTQLYGSTLPAYLRVRPGLSGLWQVSGRNHTSYEQRVRFDAYYVCNWSLWLDLYILARTVRTALLREGAF